MEIILHAHHADVTDTLRAQAESAVRRIAVRLSKVANAIVRFVGDGPTRRVEIVLRGTRHHELFAHADARAFVGVDPRVRARVRARVCVHMR